MNAVRETDGWVLGVKGFIFFLVVRFTDSKESPLSPSAKALGYCLSVRFADEDKILLTQSPAEPTLWRRGNARSRARPPSPRASSPGNAPPENAMPLESRRDEIFIDTRGIIYP
jgi:hypothetical protein